MYQDLVIMAVFILIYSTVAGAIEKTWISGAIVFTAFGLLIGPVGLDLISFKANAEKNFVVIMKDGKIYKNTIQ
jgi:multisubunit Na+/H+ antiporter MnhG subunit